MLPFAPVHQSPSITCFWHSTQEIVIYISLSNNGNNLFIGFKSNLCVYWLPILGIEAKQTKIISLAHTMCVCALKILLNRHSKTAESRNDEKHDYSSIECKQKLR